jgi:CIC family chloride channel protein
VDRRGKLVGTLSLDDVREALWQPDLKHLLIAKDLARPNTVKLFDTEPLNLALRKFVDSERAELPVVDSNDEDRVVGVLNRHDLIVAYNRQMQKYIKE